MAAWWNRPRSLAILVAVAALAACGGSDDGRSGGGVATTVPDPGRRPTSLVQPSRPAEDLLATLAEQRAVWEAARIEDYEFTVGFEVFGPAAGIYRVRVVDGQPAGITPIKTYMDIELIGLTIEEILQEIPGSIDAVFDKIEDSLDADEIDVTYDPTYGFPVSIDFDMMREAVDDEIGLRLSDFTPAAPPPTAG
jgi:hypothetical protein